MAIPIDFELIEESKHYVLFGTVNAVDLHRADMLFDAGYQIVSIDTLEMGLLCKFPYQWRISCLKVKPCGS